MLNIETAPKDGTIFTAVGRDYGTGPGTHIVHAIWNADMGFFALASDPEEELHHLPHWAPDGANGTRTPQISLK